MNIRSVLQNWLIYEMSISSLSKTLGEKNRNGYIEKSHICSEIIGCYILGIKNPSEIGVKNILDHTKKITRIEDYQT
jgi:hypothetical protein